MISKSRRDSVGGGSSSRIFPSSPKADAIQWGGRGGSSSRIYPYSPKAAARVLREQTTFGGGGGSNRHFPLLSHQVIFF